jgi:hypothetical protein
MNQNTSTDIEATLAYLINTGEAIHYEVAGPTKISEKNADVDNRRVLIRDGRHPRYQFALDEHGFKFFSHTSTLDDFSDTAAVREFYYPETEALVLAHTGASRAVTFDHTIRHGDQNTRNERQVREPVFGVHNDYTDWSAPKRVHDILPDEADDLLRRRFAIVQLWRPIRDVVRSHPLAIADARSIDDKDLIPVQRRSAERVGETYSLSYSAKHLWYYFPHMAPNEALIFKVFDSAQQGARFTAHTAFDDPTTAADAPARQSIEMRLLVFYDA